MSKTFSESPTTLHYQSLLLLMFIVLAFFCYNILWFLFTNLKRLSFMNELKLCTANSCTELTSGNFKCRARTERQFEGIQRMRAWAPEVWKIFKQGEGNKWKNRVGLSLSKIYPPESKGMSKEAKWKRQNICENTEK